MQNYVEKLSRPLVWGDDAEQIPYWLYQDEEIAKLEQKKIFGGPTWNYLCLEAEIPNRGDYRTTFIGEMPIIVARAEDGEVYAFENRCAHRGALIAIDNHGNTPAFSCVYHAWSYDLQGSLKGVAFQQGVDGKGGMPEDFVMQEHDPRKVRVASFCGLLFGSLDDDVPDIEDFLGPDISGRIERVLSKPIKVIGRSRQNLPNNWKLYFENVKDSYHASLLHLFFTTFRLNRLSQKGGVTVSEGGLHHVSYSAIDPTLDSNDIYSEQGIRSDNEDFRLADPSLLHGIDEIGDGVTLQILSVFPGFVLQQIRNSIAIRQVLPKGVDRTELNWTYIGFEDDSAELELMRLKQANLVGPAGYVSMEDGAVGNFVQRGIACASDRAGIIVMGGREVKSVDYRATETSVRGFWKAYRGFMEF